MLDTQTTPHDTLLGSLQIGDAVPDFATETTRGPTRFHEWIGQSWRVLFSRSKDFMPICTTELGHIAKIKPEFDRRNAKIIDLSLDSIDDHEKWATDIKETQGAIPDYPIIGDPDLPIAKAWRMLPATVSGDASKRTAANNQTVRNVFIIAPDKTINLTCLSDDGRTKFRQGPSLHRFAATLGGAQGGNAGTAESRRRCDHRRFRLRRRGHPNLLQWLEGATCLPSHGAAAQGIGRENMYRCNADKA
jgi:alkyl hydroperoxide reductase subunit AhpC